MAAPGDARRRTVAVAGGTGGCGKTTAVLGLAAGLARRGTRPLAVDADVDLPDLHVGAGVDREPGLPALAAGTPPGRVQQPSTRLPGVDVIAAGVGRPAVGEALCHVLGLDRPVLLDCPAGAGPDVAAPLRAADASVLVATDAPESIEDAKKTARMARALDAPPVGTVVRTGETGVATGLPAGIPTRTVPEVSGAPLLDERVRAAYERVAGLLDEDDRPRRR